MIKGQHTRPLDNYRLKLHRAMDASSTGGSKIVPQETADLLTVLGTEPVPDTVKKTEATALLKRVSSNTSKDLIKEFVAARGSDALSDAMRGAILHLVAPFISPGNAKFGALEFTDRRPGGNLRTEQITSEAIDNAMSFAVVIPEWKTNPRFIYLKRTDPLLDVTQYAGPFVMPEVGNTIDVRCKPGKNVATGQPLKQWEVGGPLDSMAVKRMADVAAHVVDGRGDRHVLAFEEEQQAFLELTRARIQAGGFISNSLRAMKQETGQSLMKDRLRFLAESGNMKWEHGSKEQVHTARQELKEAQTRLLDEVSAKPRAVAALKELFAAFTAFEDTTASRVELWAWGQGASDSGTLQLGVTAALVEEHIKLVNVLLRAAMTTNG